MSALVKGIAGGGGNLTITNGILKEYYSHTDEIPAGTFVEMADGVGGWQIQGEASIGSNTSYEYYIFHINDNLFLVVSTKRLSSAAVYGKLFTVNSDGTVTALGDATTVLYENTGTGPIHPLKLVNLSGNQYALIGGRGSSSYRLASVTFTIQDSTITAGEYIVIDSNVSLSSSGVFDCVKIEDNKLLIAFRTASSSDSSKVLVKVTTFDGSSFTSGTAVTASSTSGFYARLRKIDTNKYLLVHGDGFLNVITISGTEVTLSSRYQPQSASLPAYGGTSDLIKINETRYFYLIYGLDTTEPHPIYGVFIDISGTTITTISVLTVTNVTHNRIKLLIFEDYFVVNGELYSYVLTDDNFTCEKKSDVLSRVYEPFYTYKTNQNDTMIFYYNYTNTTYARSYIYRMVVNLSKCIPCIAPATSSASMVGFTKDRVTPEIKGKTWLLNE